MQISLCLPRLALSLLLVTDIALAGAFAADQAPPLPIQPPSLDAQKPAASPSAITAPNSAIPFENSIVQIFATLRYPDVFRPWLKQPPLNITGSGVVLEGKRILTNAHVVDYSSQLQVQSGASPKVSATVEFISRDMDLAVLKLDDDVFFETHPPLPRASILPKMQEIVTVAGFGAGEKTPSFAKGNVTRIDFSGYHHFTSGLKIQINTPINVGLSGAPAILGDQMIGLAFNNPADQKSSYVIPNEEIELFLQDIADGHFDGKPVFREEVQALENPALRAYLKLDKSVEGILVRAQAKADEGNPLQDCDVITRIGDIPVDNQGLIKLNDELRVRFPYGIQKSAKDGKAPLTIIREGKELAFAMPTAASHPLVLPDLEGAYPSYFVYGPVAFSEATSDFVNALTRGSKTAATIFTLHYLGSPLVTRTGDKPAFEGERLVVIPAPLFSHKLSNGHANMAGQVVKAVNGIPVRNLNHLVEILRDAKDEFIKVELNGRGAEMLIFPREETLAATDAILTDNGIRNQGSSEALAVWNAKGQK